MTSAPAKSRVTSSNALPNLEIIREDEDGETSNVPLDDCNVFVKYLPPDLTEKEFFQLFSGFGSIVSSKIMVDQHTGKSLGYGFVRFDSPEASQQAISEMDGSKVQKKRLLCKLANHSSSSSYYNNEYTNIVLNNQTPSNNLYIKPLLAETTEDDLKRIFGEFGTILDCKVMIDRKTGLSRQIGFVRFSTTSEAKEAIETMNHTKLDDSSPPLTVKFADTQEQKDVRRALRHHQVPKLGDDYGNPVHYTSTSPVYYNNFFGYNPSHYGSPYGGYSYPGPGNYAYKNSYPGAFYSSPYGAPPAYNGFSSTPPSHMYNYEYPMTNYGAFPPEGFDYVGYSPLHTELYYEGDGEEVIESDEDRDSPLHEEGGDESTSQPIAIPMQKRVSKKWSEDYN